MKKTIIFSLLSLCILTNCSKPKEKAISKATNQGLVETELNAWLDTLENIKHELKSAFLDGFYPQSLIVPGEINSPDYRPTSDENPLEYDVIPIPVISTTADKIATWKPEEKIETRFSLNTNEVSLLVVKNKQIIFQAFLKREYNTWKRSCFVNFHLDYAKMISKEVFINKRQLFALKFIYDQRSMPQFLLLFKEKDQFFMFDRVYYKYVPFSNHIKEPHNCLN